MAIEVTVRDTETGETETTVLKDYTIICVPIVERKEGPDA